MLFSFLKKRNNPGNALLTLRTDHSPQSIANRLSGKKKPEYLGDAVLGAIDGSITTFAVVSGVVGAELAHNVIVILGMANLLADGFSMAVSNYLKCKTEMENIEKLRILESEHIDQIPEGEREEIRQIFARKGFTSPVLEEIVNVITKDREQWIDTMLKEEWGMQLESPSPIRAGLFTFCAFTIAGMIPLLPFLIPLPLNTESIFVISACATTLSFFITGLIKGKVLNRSVLKSGLETLWIGCTAAVLAYFVGKWLKNFSTQIS
jgi:vacuolar iron transporter family protein